MRTLKIEDSKLKKILVERGEVLTEARKLQKDVEKIQKEQQKLGYQMDRLRDKTTPLIEKHTPSFGLGEFELVGRVLLENDEVVVEIVDQMEEYANMLREEKNKKK